MSVATLVGPRAGDRRRRAALRAGRASVLPRHPSGLAALGPDPSSAPSMPRKASRRAVERVSDGCAALSRRARQLVCLSDARRRRAGALRSRPSSPSAAHERLVEAACAGLLAPRVERRAPRQHMSRPCSATARTWSARGSRSRPSRSRPRTTRSAATGPRPRRRNAGSSRVRGRRPQGDGEDGDLRRRELPRRAAVRGRRARPPPLPTLLRRHAFGDRRHRDRPARARGARPPRRCDRGEARSREPRLLQVPQGRGAACDRPRRRRGPPGGRHRRPRPRRR